MQDPKFSLQYSLNYFFDSFLLLYAVYEINLDNWRCPQGDKCSCFHAGPEYC